MSGCGLRIESVTVCPRSPSSRTSEVNRVSVPGRPASRIRRRRGPREAEDGTLTAGFSALALAG